MVPKNEKGCEKSGTDETLKGDNGNKGGHGDSGTSKIESSYYIRKLIKVAVCH